MKKKSKEKDPSLTASATLQKGVGDLEKGKIECHLALEALKVSEARYRRLFETAQDGILILDAETGRIADVNPFLMDMLGYSHDDFLGKTLWDVGPFRNIKASQGVFLELQTKGYVRYENLPLETKYGRSIAVEFVSNVYDVDHEKVIQCNIRDITKRREAEEGLRKSEDQNKFLASILEISSQPVAVGYGDGRIGFVNRAFCQLVGYSEDELRRITWISHLTPPEWMEAERLKLAELMSASDSVRYEKEYLRKDGSRVPVELLVQRVEDEDNSLLYYYAFVTDLTERKRNEERLRASEAEAVHLARENETMAEIGRIIGSTLNIEEIYEGLGEVVKKIIPFDRVVINMIDRERRTVKIVFAAGRAIGDRKTDEVFPLDGSGSGEMVRTKSSLLIQTEDFDEYKDRFPMLLSTFQAGFRSILDVPLFSQGEIIGGLLFRSLKPCAYTDKDVRVAERIGSQIAGAIANIQLFQERKGMEEALIKREKQYRALIEGAGQAGEGILITQNTGDREGGIVFASKAALEMTGYSREEIRQVSWFDIIHPADRPASLIRYRQRIEGKHHPGTYEIALICKGGSSIPIEATAARTEFRDHPAVITFFRDIAKRKQVAEMLMTSEERYRNFFNNAQIGLFRTRISDGRMLEANDRMAQIHGYRSREECIRDYVVADHYLDPGTRERLLEEIQKTGEIQNFEASLSRKDGTLFWSRFSARIYPEKGYMEGIVVDMTEEKLAQEKLRESEERLRRLVENAPLGILSIDVDGNIIDINAPAHSIIGSHAAEGSRAMNLLASSHMTDAGIADQFRRCLESGEAHVFEASYRGNRGKGIHLRCYLTPILNPAGEVKGVQALLEDISERMKLEDQLLQAQKMEAIGTLAGGIAHDFNNILTGIMGYAELASWDLTEGSKAKYNIKQSISAAHRAKDLVQQILAFSRQGKQERRPMDIRPIINEGLKFLRASIPATIEIRHNIPGDMGIIEADPTQIHQVLMNICTNAAHAMSESGGLLEVSLSQFDLAPGVKGAYHGMDAGRYLKLRVSDTGHGITPAVLPRIFEPYFTTKEVGKGTGLGLATVHGIVKSYGGGITVSSEPGKGAVFEIYFPRIDTGKAPTAADQSEPLLLGEQERILFVDDESSIVEINQFMLKHLGYQVEGRTSSVEARELFRAHPERFDLVITDMTMPNMTGDKLAQELLKIRPGIPIILCTGFSEQITADKAKAMGIEEFVTKPLIIYDLAKLIRRALDRRKKIQG